MNRRGFLTAAAASWIAPKVSADGSTKMTSCSGPIGSLNSDHPSASGIRTAGIKMVQVVNRKYKVWTKRIGEGAIKVLIVHGGPGLSHEYLEAMESFLPEASIEMYYYDQLGCNNSDQPSDPSLWTLPRYVEEIEEVRQGLGLDRFYLFGHSFGGILGIEYALKYQRHLSGLILSNVSAGTLGVQSLKQLFSSPSLQRFNALSNDRDLGSVEFQQILSEQLYPKIICRTWPAPEPISRAIRHRNESIYIQMQGESPFQCNGSLKDWDRWDRLHEIEVKTLIIGARHDEIDPEEVRKMAVIIPDCTAIICPEGSHLCMWDDQEFYFNHLLAFLSPASRKHPSATYLAV